MKDKIGLSIKIDMKLKSETKCHNPVEKTREQPCLIIANQQNKLTLW